MARQKLTGIKIGRQLESNQKKNHNRLGQSGFTLHSKASQWRTSHRRQGRSVGFSGRACTPGSHSSPCDRRPSYFDCQTMQYLLAVWLKAILSTVELSCVPVLVERRGSVVVDEAQPGVSKPAQIQRFHPSAISSHQYQHVYMNVNVLVHAVAHLPLLKVGDANIVGKKLEPGNPVPGPFSAQIRKVEERFSSSSKR